MVQPLGKGSGAAGGEGLLARNRPLTDLMLQISPAGPMRLTSSENWPLVSVVAVSLQEQGSWMLRLQSYSKVVTWVGSLVQVLPA